MKRDTLHTLLVSPSAAADLQYLILESKYPFPARKGAPKMR